MMKAISSSHHFNYFAHMKIKILSILFMFAGLTAMAQSPVGVWKTIDDESGEPKSHIKIYEKNGKFFAKVVKLLPAATTDKCNGCPGDKDGKSLYDVDIVWDMKPYKDYWSYGQIVDPANGKIYKCNMSLNGNDKLDVRGYVGFSLIGRTQTWLRIE